MTKEIETLIKKTRNSSFNKHNYMVNVELKRFVSNMLLHTDYDNKDGDMKNYEWLNLITPEFQRSNNKWSHSMKVKFIENLLSGVKVELMFFRMNEQDDSKIIDGLQRTTALIDFFEGRVKPFGYSYSELEKYIGHFPSNIAIKIYTFDTWEEVGRFYIDMNENITHSSEDIQKAKDWFLSEHGIEL
jgi:hypothetical protein